MACDPQELASRSSCFFCLPAGYYYPLKLAILARWLQSVSPGANTSVAALLADASAGCIACPPGAQLGPIRLALICAATGGSGPIPPPPPAAPTDFNIDNTSLAGSIDLSWTESGSPDFIQIWLSINGGAFVLINTIPGGTLAYNDSNGVSGDLLEYKIRANKTIGGDSSFTVVRGALWQHTEAPVIGALSYPTVEAIVTDYNLVNDAGVTSASFPALQYCVDVGVFLISNCVNLTSISCPLLVSADGIDIDPVPALTFLDLMMLASMTGDFICSNTALVSIALPALTSVRGFTSQTNPVLTSISAPLLAHATLALDIHNNAVLASIDLSALIDLGVIFTFDTLGLVTLSLPALTTVSGAGISAITNCASLTTLSMPVLATIAGHLQITSNAAITSVDLSALISADAFTLDTASLVTLSLPALTTVAGGSFTVHSCASLTTVALPSLVTVNNDLILTLNGAITSVSVPNWVITDGTTINVSGNALTVASVEGILSRGVASGVTTCTFDFTGGTNAGFAALSPAGQADFLTLTTAGNTVNMNP